MAMTEQDGDCPVANNFLRLFGKCDRQHRYEMGSEGCSCRKLFVSKAVRVEGCSGRKLFLSWDWTLLIQSGSEVYLYRQGFRATGVFLVVGLACTHKLGAGMITQTEFDWRLAASDLCSYMWDGG